MPEPPDTSFGSRLAGLGKAAFGEAKRNARMAGLKAKIEKLKLVDLNKAHYALGKKCFGLGLHQDQFSAQFAAIKELEERIKAKREHASPVDAETTGAKIKRFAGETKQAAEAEGLALKEKQLLTEFGKDIAGLDHHPLELNAEVAAVAAVHSVIETETAQFTKLSEDHSSVGAMKSISQSLASEVGSKGSSAATGLWGSVGMRKVIVVVGIVALFCVAAGLFTSSRKALTDKGKAVSSTVASNLSDTTHFAATPDTSSAKTPSVSANVNHPAAMAAHINDAPTSSKQVSTETPIIAPPIKSRLPEDTQRLLACIER